jgi:hypothetical protein
MTSSESGYRLEWTAAAEADLGELRTFDARPIVQAVEELRQQAETRTRNRKPLDEPIEQLPEASWEVRVGDHRVFYDVRAEEPDDVPPAEESKPRKTVRVLRVILKGRHTTSAVVGKKP